MCCDENPSLVAPLGKNFDADNGFPKRIAEPATNAVRALRIAALRIDRERVFAPAILVAENENSAAAAIEVAVAVVAAVERPQQRCWF